jgi:hypothetical protein
MRWESETEKDTAQVFRALEQCHQLFRIDPNVVFGAIVFGNADMIVKLAAGLLRAPEQATGDTLISYLCAEMVARCADRYLSPPRELAELLSRHVRADSFAARDCKKPLAFSRAAQYSAAYPEASVREIANYAGINHNTVARWRADGALKGLADAYETLAPGITALMRKVSGKKALP